MKLSMSVVSIPVVSNVRCRVISFRFTQMSEPTQAKRLDFLELLLQKGYNLLKGQTPKEKSLGVISTEGDPGDHPKQRRVSFLVWAGSSIYTNPTKPYGKGSVTSHQLPWLSFVSSFPLSRNSCISEDIPKEL